jgi:hypothetical protein
MRIYRAHFSYDPVADPLLAEHRRDYYDDSRWDFPRKERAGNTRGTTVPNMAIEHGKPSGKLRV